MFATLVLERAPLTWQNLPGALQVWVQDAGGLAAIALLVFGVLRWFRVAPRTERPLPSWERSLFRLAVVGMVVGWPIPTSEPPCRWKTASRSR